MDILNANLLYYAFAFLVFLCVYYIIIQTYIYVILLVVGYFCYKYALKQTRTSIDVHERGIVITGCDTGFGHHAALKLDKLGFAVFAGCLSTDSQGAKSLKKSGTKSLHVIQMDVTSDTQINDVHHYVVNNLPKKGLWAIINNAAINRICDFELVTIDIMKRVAEVNYWGMVRTTKTFIAEIRRNKGRVINVTSVRGRASFPTDVSYGPTKFAGEAFSDILRREMCRFGVKVVIIEPGNFGGITGMLNKENIANMEKDLNEAWNKVPTDVKAAYGSKYMAGLLGCLKDCGSSTYPTVDPVINAMVDAVTNSRPQYRYLVQGGNKFLDFYYVAALVNGFLPESIMDQFISMMDPPPIVAKPIQST